MRTLFVWWSRVAGGFARGRQDRELRQELNAHLELHIEEHERSGMSRDEARRSALVALGGIDATREQHRDRRGLPVLEAVLQDLRFGTRMLVRHREFTLVAVSALAIGVAANVLIFSVGYAVLAMPLPNVAQPERLVRVLATRDSNVLHADYVDFRDRNRTLSDVAAIQSIGLTLRTAGAPVFVPATIVSGSYFTVLGATALQGRLRQPSDDRPGAPGALVLTDGARRRRFGGRLEILGEQLTLNGRSLTVVGIAPDGLVGPVIQPELFVTWQASGLAPTGDELIRRAGRSVQLVGRVRDSASIAEAQGDLSSIARDLERRFPDTNRGRTVSVSQARLLPAFLEGQLRPFLALLAGITGLVLLIACVNIASLLLARWQVLGFSASLALATMLVCGLAPAWRSSGLPVAASLKSDLGGSRRDPSRLRMALIVGQMAMSTLLLVMGGVLVHSVVTAANADVGFRRDGVLTATIDLTARDWTTDRRASFFEATVAQVEAAPGVRAGALAEMLPLSASSRSTVAYRDGEAPPRDERSAVVASTNNVSRGYFRTLEIPILAGRDFDARDRPGSEPVAIVNEALAQRLWPGQSAIGRRFRWFRLAGTESAVVVVGVVRDSKYNSLTEIHRPAYFRPLAQRPADSVSLLARTAGQPLSMVSTLQSRIREMDPDLAVFGAQTLESAAGFAVLPMRIAAAVASALGFVALVLAAIGIYGVTAYLVRQRTHEVGIRLALGARPASVVRLLTRQSLQWTFVGVGLGLACALAAARAIQSLLYGVGPSDPVAFIGVTTLLGGIAALACYIPGRRATRINPLTALREE